MLIPGIALVFYYGSVLVTSLDYSTKDILTVFSMLLFSMVNVKGVLSTSKLSMDTHSFYRVLTLSYSATN